MAISCYDKGIYVDFTAHALIGGDNGILSGYAVFASFFLSTRGETCFYFFEKPIARGLASPYAIGWGNAIASSQSRCTHGSLVDCARGHGINPSPAAACPVR